MGLSRLRSFFREHPLCCIVVSIGPLAVFVACGSTTNNSDGSDGVGGSTGNGNAASSVTGSSTTGASASTATGTGGTTTLAVCPSFEPAPGSACQPEGLSCSYPNCLGPDYRDGHELSCVMGAWSVAKMMLCNVPACPEGSVVAGGSCNPESMPGPCIVTDACGVPSEFYCVDDVWELSDSGADPLPGAGGADSEAPQLDTTTGSSDVAPLACPAAAPYSGDACCPEQLPETCDYSVSTTTGAFIILPPDVPTAVPLTCGRCNDLMQWEPCEIK